MKKNRTIGKRQVMDAARELGMRVIRMTNPENGQRQWRIDNYKGLAIWRDALWEVWLVVMPRPIQMPEDEAVTTEEEVMA